MNRKYNFDDLGKALMSLFVLSSRDGWVNIMYTGLDAVGVDQQVVFICLVCYVYYLYLESFSIKNHLILSTFYNIVGYLKNVRHNFIEN